MRVPLTVPVTETEPDGDVVPVPHELGEWETDDEEQPDVVTETVFEEVREGLCDAL